ncbi:MAG: hypothetical protein H6R10_3063 [Rhodocyclaceae bacterium]|nr:hypothetical protein [Rhodocyclaceae bacterium]
MTRHAFAALRVGGLAAWLAAGIGSALAAQPMGCLIEPQQVAEVGSPIIGVIEALLVDRGDRVAKGQVLARLRSDVERAAVAVADSRAQAEADEQAARANLDFARQKLERAENLLARKFISQQGLDQARAEYEVARQKAAQAAEQKRTSQRELGLAQAQLFQRVIRSPFGGIVAERYLSVGERVEEKPLFRVAKVNPLKVQVLVPASLYGKIQPGATASVQPQLPDAPAASARVTLVDKLIDGPSNTFRVQLELPNSDLSLPAGLRCKADFGPALPAAERKQAAAVPAASSLPIEPVAMGLDPARSANRLEAAAALKRSQ